MPHDRQPIRLEQPGTFTLGCNYWASHAGTRMWSDWRPDVVDDDLRTLAEAGLSTLRVFPLWSDFQPVVAIRGADGVVKELQLRTESGEQPLPDTDEGRAGVDPVMLDRFAELCRIAARHGLELVVGLVTGWMSSRLFCPPVLEGRPLHTDPLALQLQVRFVTTFVERFRDDAAVVAWDLGNECNAMGAVPSREAAWTWTALISQAIRVADPTRPVVSGMHSLLPSPELSGGWTIQDQAEHTDLLTTHPYPLWSRHTDQDPIDTVRTTLHATAESRMYSDIGERPCVVEEIGTMGPLMGDDEAAASFIRTNLVSLWAHDCRGLLWWCAFDQTTLPHAPYDWNAVERELGLLTEERLAKPVLQEITRFADLLPSLPSPLPPARVDAVCVLTRGQDAWAAAYSAFVLAMQATLNLRFAWADAPLPEAGVYLMPSVSGVEPLPRRRWLELLGRVREGATLHVTLGDGILEPFGDVFGVRVAGRSRRSAPTPFTLATGERLTARHGPHLDLVADEGTTVLAEADDGGAPMVVSRPYGDGRVTLTALPVETQLTAEPGAFHTAGREPWHALYRLLTADVERPIDSDSEDLAVTIHDDRYAVLVNHGAAPAQVRFAPGVTPLSWLHGSATVPGHQAAVVELMPAPPA